MIILFITDGMCLSFCIFMSCPEPTYGVYLVWFHFQCSVEILIYIFQFFQVWKLPLNRENFLHFGVGIGAFWAVYGGREDHWHCCRSICTSVVHSCFCTSINTFVHPYIHLYVCWYGCHPWNICDTSICLLGHLCVCQYL